MATNDVFKFKRFEIAQDKCPMKVGTDGMLLGAWADVNDMNNILDIGTGTGIIALMLGQRSESAHIDAVEIDENAYTQAAFNFSQAPWKDRMTLHNLPIQDYARITNKKYELIVSNPPFFSGGTLSTNQDKNTVRHTVKLPHSDLMRAVRALLKPEGTFAVILPLLEALRFIELLDNGGFNCIRRTNVISKSGKPVERLLMEFSRVEADTIENHLIIQKEKRNDWTDDYIALTKDFHPQL